MEFNARVDVNAWKRMQDAVSSTLNMFIMTVRADGSIITQSGTMPEYASLIERTGLPLQKRASAIKKSEKVYCCASGLYYAIAPIMIDNHHLCSIIAGGIKTEELESNAITIAKLTGIDSDALLSSLKKLALSSKESLSSFQAVVDVLSIVMPETAFRKDATHQLESMRQLLDFSNVLGTQLDPLPLMTATAKFCSEQLKLSDCSIYFGESQLRFRQDEPSAAKEAEKRICLQVMSNNTSVYLHDARRDFLLQDIKGVEAMIYSIYAVPLRINNKAFGMIAFYSSIGKIEEKSVQLFDGIATRLSASMEKAKSLSEAKVNAVTDPLTGLYNKRHLLDSLKTILCRSQEYSKPTSLVILDLDNFKSYNDSFGHPAGDVLLKDIGEILSAQAGTINIACRYGGEEFVVVMPEASSEHAQLLSEKIRRAIEARVDQFRKTTASFGLAVSLKSDVTPEKLISEADKALYESKKTGKNKVTTKLIVDAKLNAYGV